MGLFFLVFLTFISHLFGIRYELTGNDCFYENLTVKTPFIFYFKVLGGPGSMVKAAISNSKGAKIYEKESNEDYMRLENTERGEYTFCFYREDFSSLSNQIIFEIILETTEIIEDHAHENEKDEIPTEISEDVRDISILMNSFAIKLEMNHGDLENDILVVLSLHEKVLNWSVFLTVFIIVYNIVQLVIIKRLFS